MSAKRTVLFLALFALIATPAWSDPSGQADANKRLYVLGGLMSEIVSPDNTISLGVGGTYGPVFAELGYISRETGWDNKIAYGQGGVRLYDHFTLGAGLAHFRQQYNVGWWSDNFRYEAAYLTSFASAGLLFELPTDFMWGLTIQQHYKMRTLRDDTSGGDHFNHLLKAMHANNMENQKSFPQTVFMIQFGYSFSL